MDAKFNIKLMNALDKNQEIKVFNASHKNERLNRYRLFFPDPAQCFRCHS